MRWPHPFYPACHCAPPQCQVAKIRIDIHVCIHQPSDSATRIHIHVTHTSRYTRRHPYARKDVTISYRTGLDRIQGLYLHASMARHDIHLLLMQKDFVSIHAPAGGATAKEFIWDKLLKFLSTRPRGARPCLQILSMPTGQFLSTRPRGARLAAHWQRISDVEFLSTRPRGARHTGV